MAQKHVITFDQNQSELKEGYTKLKLMITSSLQLVPWRLTPNNWNLSREIAKCPSYREFKLQCIKAKISNKNDPKVKPVYVMSLMQINSLPTKAFPFSYNSKQVFLIANVNFLLDVHFGILLVHQGNIPI